MEQVLTDIQVLQANYGDCIFISMHKGGEEYNILIDGGVSKTYYDVRNRLKPQGPLKSLLDNLRNSNRVIDLLILTHVDNDHVSGLKAWFKDDFPTSSFVKCFWVNDDIEIPTCENLDNSVSSTSLLIKSLRDNGFDYCNQIVKGMIHENDFCIIRVLTPSEVFHNKIAKEMDKEMDNILDNAANSTYDISIRDYIDKSWVNGSLSHENKASIAIEIESRSGEKILMLGDAEINDIIDGIEFFHKSEERPIEYSWIKLAHHGSRNNFDPRFLDLVKARNFIVSTNGAAPFHHPSKDVIAYIVDKTTSNIHFNYPDRAKDLFRKEDYIDYPSLKERIKEI